MIEDLEKLVEKYKNGTNSEKAVASMLCTITGTLYLGNDAILALHQHVMAFTREALSYIKWTKEG